MSRSAAAQLGTSFLRKPRPVISIRRGFSLGVGSKSGRFAGWPPNSREPASEFGRHLQCFQRGPLGQCAPAARRRARRAVYGRSGGLLMPSAVSMIYSERNL